MVWRPAVGSRLQLKIVNINTFSRRTLSKWNESPSDRPAWSEEWKRVGLGARLVETPRFPSDLFFVQMGFGVDQHGTRDATKAAVRAVRNAIEFNSIPGVISHLPGGRHAMLSHVKLGIPVIPGSSPPVLMPVDLLQVANVFPYGQILPMETCVGGLSFHTGRVVEELGDDDDLGICVAACITLGSGGSVAKTPESGTLHTTYNTKDGF